MVEVIDLIKILQSSIDLKQVSLWLAQRFLVFLIGHFNKCLPVVLYSEKNNFECRLSLIPVRNSAGPTTAVTGKGGITGRV